MARHNRRTRQTRFTKPSETDVYCGEWKQNPKRPKGLWYFITVAECEQMESGLRTLPQILAGPPHHAL